jgi:hypothetical protein
LKGGEGLKWNFLILILLVVSIFILSACNNVKNIQHIDSEKIKTKYVDLVEEMDNHYIVSTEFKTEDRKLSIKVHNKSKLTRDKIEFVMDELLIGYESITAVMTEIELPSETLDVIIYDSDNASHRAFLDSIHIISSDEFYEEVIVHELSHFLLNDYTAERDYFFEEGFASYLQEEIGSIKSYVGAPNHNVMNYFITHNKVIDLNDLMINDNVHTILKNLELESGEQFSYKLWLGYVQAQSFIAFLIEQYGFDLYKQLHFSNGQSENLVKVYKKNLEELELEWLDYVGSDSFRLTTKQKRLFNYDYVLSIIKTLDYFEGKVD